MTSSSDRLDRIEALLERFIDASVADRQASNERMKATDERLEKLSEKTDARFHQLATEAEANHRVTFEMLEQLTTLQEESRRLLDYLFGQQRNGNSDQPQP